MKVLTVLSANMLQSDFMFGFTGRGGIFSVHITDLPDYSEDLAEILIRNTSNMSALVRLSLDNDIDSFVEPGTDCVVTMEQLRGAK